MALEAPFPWFGGKSSVAAEVWARFGEVKNYVEPFFGSGAVLLGRPGPVQGLETVNDKDGAICNFWRAVQHDPDAVAGAADWPAIELDLHARKAGLDSLSASLAAKLGADADYFDARLAGWWLWGVCRSIGGHFGTARRSCRIFLGGGSYQTGQGVFCHGVDLRERMRSLCARMSRVRVCSGDWSRLCTPSVTSKRFPGEATAVFLDPPYGGSAKRSGLYREESTTVAADARAWAIASGDNLRVALCGYEGEHDMPRDWSTHAWVTPGGLGNTAGVNQYRNARRERIWFSPACLGPHQPGLFDAAPSVSS